jgi:hypothetical protein
MDQWEAHYIVKWQREAWVARQNTAKLLQAQGCDVSVDDDVTKADVWFWDDEY